MSAVRSNSLRRAAVLIAVIVSGFPTSAARADSLKIAAASNFAPAMGALGAAFEASTGHRLRFSFASTGKLYAQIVNGAPFDVFLAADVARPMLLERSGLAIGGSRFTYAIGSLVLWSRDPDMDCSTWLVESTDGKLAIANPLHAPYGVAAREALETLGVWERYGDRLVVGENIAQTMQFAASGNASAGLVAASQLSAEQLPAAGCTERVAETLHPPVEQQAVVLMRAADNAAVREFVDFLKSAEARVVIERFGYRLPDTAERGSR